MKTGNFLSFVLFVLCVFLICEKNIKGYVLEDSNYPLILISKREDVDRFKTLHYFSCFNGVDQRKYMVNREMFNKYKEGDTIRFYSIRYGER